MAASWIVTVFAPPAITPTRWSEPPLFWMVMYIADEPSDVDCDA